jgi:hypothetical protein
MFVKAARGAPDDVWPALSAARIIGTDGPPAERLPDHMRRWLEEFAPEAPRRSLHHRLPCALPSSKSLFNGLPTTNFDECCPHNPEAASLGFQPLQQGQVGARDARAPSTRA